MNKTPIAIPAPVPFFARTTNAQGSALVVKTGIKAGFEPRAKQVG